MAYYADSSLNETTFGFPIQVLFDGATATMLTQIRVKVAGGAVLYSTPELVLQRASYASDGDLLLALDEWFGLNHRDQLEQAALGGGAGPTHLTTVGFPQYDVQHPGPGAVHVVYAFIRHQHLLQPEIEVEFLDPLGAAMKSGQYYWTFVASGGLIGWKAANSWVNRALPGVIDPPAPIVPPAEPPAPTDSTDSARILSILGYVQSIAGQLTIAREEINAVALRCADVEGRISGLVTAASESSLQDSLRLGRAIADAQAIIQLAVEAIPVAQEGQQPPTRSQRLVEIFGASVLAGAITR